MFCRSSGYTSTCFFFQLSISKQTSKVVLGILSEDEMSVTLAHRRIFETVDGCTRIYATG